MARSLILPHPIGSRQVTLVSQTEGGGRPRWCLGASGPWTSPPTRLPSGGGSQGWCPEGKTLRVEGPPLADAEFQAHSRPQWLGSHNIGHPTASSRSTLASSDNLQSQAKPIPTQTANPVSAWTCILSEPAPMVDPSSHPWFLQPDPSDSPAIMQVQERRSQMSLVPVIPLTLFMVPHPSLPARCFPPRNPGTAQV